MTEQRIGRTISRRAMLARGIAIAAAGLTVSARLQALAPGVVHPDPRPGVDASRVLSDEQVPAARHKDAYAAARELPAVMDGLFCYCDCAEHRGLRSLLSCFESRMPQSCGVCLGEARLAGRMHHRGATLPEIRRAIDKAFGDG